MVKQILKISFCALCLLMPVSGVAGSYGMTSESTFEMVETVKIAVKGHSVRVLKAEGLTLEVYSVTGAKVLSVKIDSEDQTVLLNLSRGCYIVKVGDVTRKISVL